MDMQKLVGLSTRSDISLAKQFPGVAEEIMDQRLCDAARAAMREKLEKKSGQGRGGWWDRSRCSTGHLRQLLREHLEKGDMVDVMNFAAMIYVRECVDKAG
jgi:hypothetical protein